MTTEPDKDVEVIRGGVAQVLRTLKWAEANVPGTNLQSDIIMLERVITPRLDSLDSRLLTAEGEGAELHKRYAEALRYAADWPEEENKRAALQERIEELTALLDEIVQVLALSDVPTFVYREMQTLVPRIARALSPTQETEG